MARRSTTQRGLVNVNRTDVSVQTPVALAANVCDMNVAVLADELADGTAPCTASADPASVVTTQSGGPVQQRGLVNVNVSDLVVQVPSGIAANVCDVNVDVLSAGCGTPQLRATPPGSPGAKCGRATTRSVPVSVLGFVEGLFQMPLQRSRDMSRFPKFFAAAALAATGVIGASGVADAQPVTQQGLVNVNLTDVSVQVPVALAANVCDVNVAVLVQDLADQSAPCTASADPTSVVTTDSSGPVRQRGLVNVNVTDLVVQVPIGIAANVCDVNAGVLVNTLRDTAATCDATGTPGAITVIG